MKKKVKTKRKYKAVLKKDLSKHLSLAQLALMEKVKRQLDELHKPIVVSTSLRTLYEQRELEGRAKRKPLQIRWCGDILLYKLWDPFWMTTMTGAMTGRVLGKGRP